MTEFVTDGRDSGKTIEYAICRRFGNHARNKLFKALRNRDVKLDGKRTGTNDILSENVRVTVYEDFEKEAACYSVLFENDSFIAVEKPQGIPVQDDKNGEMTLIDAVRKDFGPSCRLCHRLDRNTGGIVLIAKNDGACEIITSMMDSSKGKTCIKYYTCIVSGRPAYHGSPVTLKNYLFKDNKKSTVYIYDEPVKGAVPVALEYELMSYDGETDTSKLRVRLLTGKTHQIRAQLAHAGHQIIGDGKYGREQINGKFKYRYQALWASEIRIPKSTDLFAVQDHERPDGASEGLQTTMRDNCECVTIRSTPAFR